MALELKSTVIKAGGEFPVDYTCNGRNISPPLNVSGIPAAAKSLVLIFDDPDAAKEPAGRGKTFDHWVVYNILATDQTIAEDSVPAGARLGQNGAGSDKYIGPCPPTFRHTYYFRLLALDNTLDLVDRPTKDQVLEASTSHVIEETQLVAYYEQPASTSG